LKKKLTGVEESTLEDVFLSAIGREKNEE